MKWDLMFGCLGNGTTVWNRDVIKNGDYQNVAHISEHGHVKLYVERQSIPEELYNRILKVAENDKKEFMEKWNKFSVNEKWRYMMEIPTIGCGFNAFTKIQWENSHLPIAEQVQKMEPVFFNTHM